MIDKNYLLFYLQQLESFEGHQIEGKLYIERSKFINDFIDVQKLEEEALKLIDNYYGIPDYGENGDIIHIHNYAERKDTKHLLKSECMK